ncbi:hypothetical protein TRFO_01671 [Tritrichomonas foetus]|uniref:Uncharacterized protein n=1 Tax=Tritrichomonas foetus TaxID=1144522 RepID=A0A1J4JPK7_9EUKA|nr:hypothetical protein TRFO_01671 [Tritrichomonas foetus]|eukprot:OHT01095.1 hypothetical protein TRFO_01671 [Tritrichomonas foetus]
MRGPCLSHSCRNIVMKCALANQTALKKVTHADFEHLNYLKPKLFLISPEAISIRRPRSVFVQVDSKTRILMNCDHCQVHFEIILTSIPHFALVYQTTQKVKSGRRQSTPTIMASISTYIPKEIEIFLSPKLSPSQRPDSISSALSTGVLQTVNINRQISAIRSSHQFPNFSHRMSIDEPYSNENDVPQNSDEMNTEISKLPQNHFNEVDNKESDVFPGFDEENGKNSIDENDCDLALMFSRNEEIYVGSYESGWNPIPGW